MGTAKKGKEAALKNPNLASKLRSLGENLPLLWNVCLNRIIYCNITVNAPKDILVVIFCQESYRHLPGSD